MPTQDEVSASAARLANRQCVPCTSDTPPLTPTEAEALLCALSDAWSINDAGHLVRGYGFDDFMGALAFANRVGAIAEEQGHHPDLWIRWGRCRIEVWTHAIDGLSEADFILAAKVERAHRG